MKGKTISLQPSRSVPCGRRCWDGSSFDCKAITTKKFEEQKMNYIHMNPLRRNPPLCTLPEDYPHSSAAFYITGDATNFHGIVSMEDWMIKQQTK